MQQTVQAVVSEHKKEDMEMMLQEHQLHYCAWSHDSQFAEKYQDLVQVTVMHSFSCQLRSSRRLESNNWSNRQLTALRTWV
jgi:hypothetical protein